MFGFTTTTSAPAAAPTQSSFSFGTPAGLSFGAPVAQSTPAFGGGVSSTPGPGQPSSQPQQQPPSGGFGFSAPNLSQPQPSVGFGLGLGSTAPQAPQATQQTGFAFPTASAVSSQPQPSGGGFSLGGTTTSTSQPSAGGFSFGAPSAAPASASGFSLSGAPTGTTNTLAQPQGTAPAPGFSLGGTTNPPSTQQPGGGFSFGGLNTASTSQPQPQSTGGFGTTATTTTTASSQPGGGFSFGGGTAAAASSSQPQPSGFSFGTTSTAATTQPSGFSFGGPTTTNAPTSSAFSLGGMATTTTTSATATTSTPFTGLGGSSAAQQQSGSTAPLLSTAQTKPDGLRSVLELPVPPEVLQIVDELKIHMKNQKVKISEISRASDKNIDKVSEEIDETRLAVSTLTNQVHRQLLFCDALMKDIQQEMKNLEMAMVTRDTPLALQHDISTTGYFFNLVGSYHERMIAYKREIERAETALASLGQNSSVFSPQDLMLALKSSKETVIALAAKIQDLHERVVNEMNVSRNLKRFPSEGGDKGPGGRMAPRSELASVVQERGFDKSNIGFTPGLASTRIGQMTGGAGSSLFDGTASSILGSHAALKRTKH